MSIQRFQRVFVRNMCISLRNPLAPERPMSPTYQKFLTQQTKFWESTEMTHNKRGKNFYPSYIVAPFFAAFFLPALFLQKCLGNRKA